ncbi:hypothetical protein QQ045_033421 [Rhodiola kirilowii]
MGSQTSPTVQGNMSSLCNNHKQFNELGGHREGFGVKDTYNTLIEHTILVEWHNLVWNEFNVPRDSFNAWLAIQNKLMTKNRMSKWGFLGAKTYVLCATMDESRDIFTLLAILQGKCGIREYHYSKYSTRNNSVNEDEDMGYQEGAVRQG